ncbi:uncharacterized protein BO97DRAFT_207637 [Aspergillus homomorphus CBS 101889]|uniref:Uncharacterized protein n=1 Tax=Aspergillus homomorphus (strain CBS 101889) TaxID=1450537 RepID=A0A395I8E3_ASPHC|nr:hypothetical protein BO97DRAFT_207637 [Aspergillus homomorphus CBS 101889]RAL15308.1 hypothetical protein BO97DRAFT_207637 [Aspergillus homomorphus CBS 101889]
MPRSHPFLLFFCPSPFSQIVDSASSPSSSPSTIPITMRLHHASFLLSVSRAGVSFKKNVSDSPAIITDVTHTFYGFPDNDPPGSTIAYDCGRGDKASGTGTYDNPLTFATAQEPFDLCKVIYVPYPRKF